MLLEKRKHLPFFLANVALEKIAQVEDQLGETRSGLKVRDSFADFFVVKNQPVNDRLAFRQQRAHVWKQDLLFRAKMSLEISPEEITKLLRSQPQPFSSHGLELSERLLATPQRQGQALVMITGQGYEAGMAHRL